MTAAVTVGLRLIVSRLAFNSRRRFSFSFADKASLASGSASISFSRAVIIVGPCSQASNWAKPLIPVRTKALLVSNTTLARIDHFLSRIRKGFDGVAGHEPRGADVVPGEQSQNALSADEPHLAPGDGGRRGHAPRNPSGHHVEVESQADKMARHARNSTHREREGTS